jgi:hypothetical protein
LQRIVRFGRTQAKRNLNASRAQSVGTADGRQYQLTFNQSIAFASKDQLLSMPPSIIRCLRIRRAFINAHFFGWFGAPLPLSLVKVLAI